jgi:hypothetical protein
MTRADRNAPYLEPTQDSGRAFMMRKIIGEVVMLNLLRFRDIADYSATPQLAPALPIGGAEAFQRYIDHTLPFLRESGGDLLFLGQGGGLLIGPQNERWDLAMLVRQKSVESFLAFASHGPYLTGIGHRTAALEDSRLLPLTEARVTSLPEPPPRAEPDIRSARGRITRSADGGMTTSLQDPGH